MARCSGVACSRTALATSSEAEDARGFVLRQRGGADDLRQLPGGQAARQVHLEEAILAVQETRRVREIRPRHGGDSGYAESVALDE